MKISDEQYAKIGDAVYKDGWPAPAEGVSRGNERLGRAAVAAVAPLVVEEALGLINAEENYAARVAYEETRNLCQAIHRVFDLRRVRLTAKPDPAVGAVAGMLCALDHANQYSYHVEAAKIVAAVDAARSKLAMCGQS